jgi:hypothetical protein
MAATSENPQAESADIEQRRVCHQCVSEGFLSAEIRKSGVEETCHYCKDHTKTWAIGKLADCIGHAFKQHYDLVQEGDYDGKQPGEQTVDAIAGAAEVEVDIAEDITAVLSDRHFDEEAHRMGEYSQFAEDAHYTRRSPDDIEYQIQWDEFERSIKTEARFFSGSARATLERVFEELAHHRTEDQQPVVIEAGPGLALNSFFRARVFQTEKATLEAIKRPDLSVGPPPLGTAAAGRMNAAGISVFYGAKSIKAAIAEVRPPVGSYVIVGRFELLKLVHLLDVEALRSVYVTGSIFDPAHLGRIERAKFLGSLGRRLSRAVMPDDHHEGYLVTQVIADYLANIVRLDGMVFRSVQVNEAGANVALFHHAAAVEPMVLPDGITLDSMGGDAFDEENDVTMPSYHVREILPEERLPAKPEDAGPSADLDTIMGAPIDLSASVRSPTLKLAPESVEVHHIDAVSYSSDPAVVSRSRVKPSRFDSRRGRTRISPGGS